MQLTRDSLWQGRLCFWQPARGHGYRFNLDPVLLSGFVLGGGTQLGTQLGTLLDLGAGCGVLGILLLAAGRCLRATAVERQPELARLCARNAHDNGFAERLRVVCSDVREFGATVAGETAAAAATSPAIDSGERVRCFDRVVFNPPYFRDGHGDRAGDRGRDAARHERHGALGDFVACAARHLAPGGSVCVIVPCARVPDLEAALRAARLVVRRRRGVRPRATASDSHMMLEAAASAHEALTLAGAEIATASHAVPCVAVPCVAVVEPSLVVHAGTGRAFTDEVDALLRPPH